MDPVHREVVKHCKRLQQFSSDKDIMQETHKHKHMDERHLWTLKDASCIIACIEMTF